jgi:hypothetical protein
MWARKDALATTAILWSSQTHTNTHISVNTSGQIQTRIGGSVDGTSQLTSGAGQIVEATWYHLALTWDGTTLALYKNGVSLLSDNTMTLVFAAGDMYLCRRSDGTLPWDGDLDEVRIYTRALSAGDVAALHQFSGGLPAFHAGGGPGFSFGFGFGV